MAKGKKNSGNSGEDIFDLRHPQSSRLNIPPAGLVARGNIEKEKQIEYDYNPHLPPVLRFDDTGKPDRITELIRASQERKLTAEEVSYLEAAFNNHQPWLEWTGKKEQHKCVVDPVALNIHERISAQAIISAARREDIQRDIFADPDMDYNKAIQFYKHPMGWTNRMILGDSLAVMASLSRREALAGKIQMIYMDPPYGIKYSSNFQTEVYKRDVKESDDDLTREIETIKAYRDTWRLGIHSYLSYIRDRLVLCKELLSDSGCVFVQISDENQHSLRLIMDEVFGKTNFVSLITLQKIYFRGSDLVDNVSDYLILYAKDASKMKYRNIFRKLTPAELNSKFKYYYDDAGNLKSINEETEAINFQRSFLHDNMLSPGASTEQVSIDYRGKIYSPDSNYHWKTGIDGLIRLKKATRLIQIGSWLKYIRYSKYFPYGHFHNIWTDTVPSTYAEKKIYAVQTYSRVIQRCILMTTDPGDLVLDPTCGGGTTAYSAELWARRWITIDVSRVSVSLTKQRLLTSLFPYYKLRPTNGLDIQNNPSGTWIFDPQKNIDGTCTFACKTAAHITLKSISQNHALDPIFEKWDPIIQERLKIVNLELSKLPDTLIKKLHEKYIHITRTQNKKDIQDDDYRRLILPPYLKRDYNAVDSNFTGWYEWEVPYLPDDLYPNSLSKAISDFRQTISDKNDEIDMCIQARADQEELLDQPIIDSNFVRVSGPFTIEGIIPIERSIDSEYPSDDNLGVNLETYDLNSDTNSISESQNSEAYLDYVIKLLKDNGIQVDKDTQYSFLNIEKQNDGSSLHASGAWRIDDKERNVAVTIGPQYGAINSLIVEESIRIAARRGFDDLVFAAFSFEGAAQAIIQQDQDPNLRIHLAHISPDVNMGDLLKNTQAKSLFTITGSPRVSIHRSTDESYIVKMEGVDIYDPITNSILPTTASKVAAWFLDADYDGKCFCICQAFFPNRDAWSKIAKALKDSLEEEEFEKYSGTESIPFKAGKYKTIAVKVIDPRGNEVIRIERLV